MSERKNNFIQFEYILISETAYYEMMDFAYNNRGYEVIGIFFGEIVNSLNKRIIVQSAIPMRVGGHVYAEFIDSDYEIMAVEIKKHSEKNQSIIGWFHSHPFGNKSSIYMSSTDIFFHFNAMRFYNVWIALVLDPYRIDDSSTFRGLKAFNIKVQKIFGFLIKKQIEIPIRFETS